VVVIGKNFTKVTPPSTAPAASGASGPAPTTTTISPQAACEG